MTKKINNMPKMISNLPGADPAMNTPTDETKIKPATRRSNGILPTGPKAISSEPGFLPVTHIRATNAAIAAITDNMPMG